MNILLTPPLAFLIYIPLVIAISLFGKLLSGRQPESSMQNEIYASGEEGPTNPACTWIPTIFPDCIFLCSIASWNSSNWYRIIHLANGTVYTGISDCIDSFIIRLTN